MEIKVGDQVRIIVCPLIYKLCAPLIGRLGRVVYIYPTLPGFAPDGLIRVRLDGKDDLVLYEDEVEVVSINGNNKELT